MSSMLEVQGVARDKNDSFPYSGMRLLGCIQLNIGILVFVLGVTDIIVTMVTYYDDAKTYGEDYDTIVSLTIASSPLWCGMWYSITGALGLCITRDRASSLQFLKIGFLILNILCCAMFGPVCAVICGYISYRVSTRIKGMHGTLGVSALVLFWCATLLQFPISLIWKNAHQRSKWCLTLNL